MIVFRAFLVVIRGVHAAFTSLPHPKIPALAGAYRVATGMRITRF